MGGAAADHLSAMRPGGGTALPRLLQLLDRRFAGLADPVTSVLASHGERGAHVLAPFKAIIALAPAEHTSLRHRMLGEQSRRRSESRSAIEPARDDGRALAPRKVANSRQ